MIREFLKNNANYSEVAIEKYEELLDNEDQVKYFSLDDPETSARFRRALKSDFTILTIDRGEKAAIIKSQSGKIYITTTRGCTCPDSNNSLYICKHMIALFIELGLIDKDGNFIIQEKKEKEAPPAKVFDNVKICKNCSCIFPLENNKCPSCGSSDYKYKYELPKNNEKIEPVALIAFVAILLFVIFCFVGMFL